MQIFSVGVKTKQNNLSISGFRLAQQTNETDVTIFGVGPKRVNSWNRSKILVLGADGNLGLCLFRCRQRVTPHVLRWWRCGDGKQSAFLLLGNRNQLFSFNCWQRSLHCEYSILAERGFYALRVCSFGQHEFSVVLPVH